MMRPPGRNCRTDTLSALAAGIALAAATGTGLGAEAAGTAGVKARVLELTGGRRAKVVWNQGENDGVPLIR